MDYTVYTGCYTGPEGGVGVGLWSFDADSGTLTKRAEYPCDAPSFLAVTEQCVYAVSERPESGCITAFRREAGGELAFLDRVDTEGGDMCHLSVWPDGRHISAANYATGSLLVRELGPDGRLGRETAFVQHAGTGPDPERQEGPHVHATAVSPDGMLFASDLGLDWLSAYEIGGGGGLTEAPARFQLHTEPGDGPRHFLFAGEGRRLYLVSELGNRLYVYTSDAGGAPYVRAQTLSTLPVGFSDDDLAADLHLSPDGRYLYVSNRGSDCLALFAADAESGLLEPRGHFPSGGSWPRNFCISPDGRWMIAANQRSGRLCVFPLDGETGAPGPEAFRAEARQVTFVTAV